MSLSISELILDATQTLRLAGVPDSHREAGSLMQFVIQRDRTFLLSHPEVLLTEDQEKQFRQSVERRARGEPLQYISGRQDFFGLEFEITTDVLIPRPETELLVETALNLLGEAASPFFCDLGTGSGCIAVALLNENQRASGVGIDLSEAAIQVARRNAARHSVAERLSFLVADCLSALHPAQNEFDLVVSNPPYVADPLFEGLQREVREHEPRMALVSGPDGLDMIRRLLAEAAAFLKPGGHLLLEIGFDQGAAVERLINRSLWKLLDIHHDLQGIPRIVALEKIASD